MSSPQIVIYGLVDPFTNELRYIGQTTRGKERLWEHFKGNRHTYTSSWIKSVKAKGAKPEWLVIEEHLCCNALNDAEKFWIAYFKAIGARLTNGTDGGDHTKMTADIKEKISSSKKGEKRSAETRLRISAAKKNPSQETRDRISASQKNRSVEWRAKLGAAHKGKVLSEETRAKMSAVRKGRTVPTETRAKMCLAQQKRRSHVG